MPRPRRPQVSNGVYHVVVRGNNKQKIFLEKDDYKIYLRYLEECKEKHLFKLFLYVLMPNHVHLLLRTSEEEDLSVSRIMHFLNSRYSKYFNKRHERSGHLLQGRFFSELIEEDAHLVELTRYIHLNPVRAGLAKNAGDYPFSSFHFYTDKEQLNRELVDCDEILKWFGKLRQFQIKRYELFVEEGLKLWELRLKIGGEE